MGEQEVKPSQPPPLEGWNGRSWDAFPTALLPLIHWFGASEGEGFSVPSWGSPWCSPQPSPACSLMLSFGPGHMSHYIFWTGEWRRNTGKDLGLSFLEPDKVCHRE